MLDQVRINGLTGRKAQPAATPWQLRLLVIPMLVAFIPALGCVSVKAPEKINVNSNRPARVDSGRVPHITTVEQGRAELDKAYQNIRYLEDRVAKLERDKDDRDDND